MKSLLSENMLRFGTKNLPESAKQRLVLESIMQTIHENDLAYEVSSRLTEAELDAEKEINGWFRKVETDWRGTAIYPTLAFLSYVSGGQAKINAGYYANWIKAGATEKAAEAYDILGIFRPAITFSNIPKLATKDANSLHAAIMAELKKGTQYCVVYSPIGTGMPSGQDADAIKKLSAKTSTYTYYSYKLKKNITGGVPCADTTYTGPGKGSLYQLALETAVAYM